jgi:hypothetical protein
MLSPELRSIRRQFRAVLLAFVAGRAFNSARAVGGAEMRTFNVVAGAVLLAASVSILIGVRDKDECAVPDELLSSLPPEEFPEQVTLISLFASCTQEDLRFAPESPEMYEGKFPIIGCASYPAREDRQAIVDALRRSLFKAPGKSPACFLPRHLIRFVGKQGTEDYLICFSCSIYRRFKDGKAIDGGRIGDCGRETLNQLLRRAGVTLSPGA